MSNIGKPKSLSARQNMSDARKGKEPWNKNMKMPEDWAWNKGKKYTDEEKERYYKTPAMKQHLEDLHKSQVGVPKSDETKRKISQTLKGRKLPESTTKKMSLARKGKKHSPETYIKGVETRKNNGHCRKIINLDTGEIFDSMADAKRKYDAKNIDKVLKGQIKRCAGYRWAYYE